MRIFLDRRAPAGRYRTAHPLLRHRPDRLITLGLLLAVIFLVLRLIWIVVTPLAPPAIAPERPRSASPDVFVQFDPFFRRSGAEESGTVTSVDLKLFGVRQDRATGRGSAIIGLPDGRQQSFAVGEALLPGITLSAVSFDNVTIAHGGRREMLFLDQSRAAAPVGSP